MQEIQDRWHENAYMSSIFCSALPWWSVILKFDRVQNKPRIYLDKTDNISIQRLTLTYIAQVIVIFVPELPTKTW